MSGDFWGSQEGCQGPSRPSGRSRGLPLRRRRAVDRNIMKVAVAEMLYCPDIPHVVSIDEAIEIAKDFSDEKSGLFMNGILNGIKNEIEKNPAGGRPE